MLEKQLEDFWKFYYKPLISISIIHVNSPSVMTSGLYLLMIMFLLYGLFVILLVSFITNVL
jgi:hypothetical protein